MPLEEVTADTTAEATVILSSIPTCMHMQEKQSCFSCTLNWAELCKKWERWVHSSAAWKSPFFIEAVMRVFHLPQPGFTDLHRPPNVLSRQAISWQELSENTFAFTATSVLTELIIGYDLIWLEKSIDCQEA